MAILKIEPFIHTGLQTLPTPNCKRIVKRYNYTAFGSILSDSGDFDNVYQFTSQAIDENDLYYMHARYYDKSIGRFTSTDPFPGYRSIPSTMHPYNYCGNNPVNFVDPLGLVWRWTWDPELGWHLVWFFDWVVTVKEDRYDYEDYGYFDAFDAWNTDPPQYGNEGKNRNQESGGITPDDPTMSSETFEPFDELMKMRNEQKEKMKEPEIRYNWRPLANTAVAHPIVLADLIAGVDITQDIVGSEVYGLAIGGDIAYIWAVLSVAAGFAAQCPPAGLVVGGGFVFMGTPATWQIFNYYKTHPDKGVFK